MLTFGKVAQVTLAFALPTSIILVYWWYKNRSDDDAYGKQKFVTSRNISIEVKVPQQAIGAVIGRQGSKIKQIQKETGAWMHFQGKDNSEVGDGDGSSKTQRTLVIRGAPESAHQAELMVYQIIADLSQILTEADIEVPCYAVGRIIGKGGGTIREISSISGARINIDRSDSLTNTDRRMITLTGSRQQIDKALELVQCKLEEEELFRDKLSMAATTKEHLNKSKELKEQIKITAVPRNIESWDVSSNTCSSNQERLQNNVSIEVYVTAVEHPGHFWVQVIGTSALQLEQLQNDITNFACSDEARLNYTVTEVKPGELVAAMFEADDGTYYRAKIVEEIENGKVDLYFVDFGDNAYAEKKDIFRLRSDFASFPIQAIECVLANVQPVGAKWSEEAITFFEDMTYCAQWKPILAHGVTYKDLNRNHKMPVVQLLDRSGPQDIDLGAALVKQGHALSCDSLGQSSQTILTRAPVLEATSQPLQDNAKSGPESAQVTVFEDS